MNINNKITEYQYIALVHSTMIAVGILSVAQSVTNDAHQQGWISVLIGGVYPIVVVVMAAYIDEKMNHIDFLKINNEIYGKFLTYVIVLIFFAMFLFLEVSVLSGFTNVLNLTIVNYIPRYIILIVITLLNVYSVIYGLTNIGRLCELFFYLMIAFVVLMMFFIPRGDIRNIKPIITSYKDIIKAIPATLYSYTGVEISYISLSFITNRKNAKKAGIIAVFTIIFIYTLNIFITIHFLGWELTSKVYYPLLYLVSTIHLPLVENFKILLIFLWSSIIFRILVCDLFASSYCLSKVIKMNYRGCCIICSILALGLSYFFIPEYNRTKILDTTTPYIVIFGVLWGVITSVLVRFKRR
ncbi:GerAB/ArcD/ProY family transporter [Clostridium aciditolerans]|uniref:GerAB/ArcD/ProY family transporter n=1 Tax=Clostridium aciditolerans TaxID=339861 RepID=A0A934M303_9CLOT|nr:GerAB/ArcD/ProY family transporter [Clostridium aciditolerans]MBI6872505.1 GerAB/ArcD/ProY family transporter [Clostridium aciditolerans]